MRYALSNFRNKHRRRINFSSKICSGMSVLNHEYNPLRYAMRANPYAAYEKMREFGSVVWSERYQHWLILSYTEAQEALRSSKLSSDISTILLHGTYPETARDTMQPALDFFKAWLLFSDDPFHAQFKKTLSPFFAPDALNFLREETESYLKKLCEKKSGDVEVMAEIIKPLTYRTIALLLNLPLEHIDKYQKWNYAGSRFLDAPIRTPALIQDFLLALDEQKIFLSKYIKEKPTENSWWIISMFLGTGTETSSNLIGNGLLALLQHPLQFQMLRQNPELLHSALNEILRFDSPVQSVFRVAKEDMILGNKKISAGDGLQIVLAMANRDPAVFSKPNIFDITRAHNPHLAFGFAAHFCLGRFLAYMTAEIFFKTIMEKFSDIKLKEQQLDWEAGLMLRSLKKLPILLYCDRLR
jgi:pimeloyl-[acyl-carrier protein] synthase